MTLTQRVTDLNLISDYLAQRDLPDLTADSLQAKDITQFDLAILFGGALPAAADTLGQLWQLGRVKQLLIVGGIGHTTDHLRKCFNNQEGTTEAELFTDYLVTTYDIPRHSILVESASTNCGENVQYALDTLLAAKLRPKATLIMQEASMQRRMGATIAKIWPESFTSITSYAPYRPTFCLVDNGITLEQTIWGIWEPERYIELLLGEIPRLRDDPTGYGPTGQDFIAHVEIPPTIYAAFERLAKSYPDLIRQPYQQKK